MIILFHGCLVEGNTEEKVLPVGSKRPSDDRETHTDAKVVKQSENSRSTVQKVKIRGSEKSRDDDADKVF